MPAVSFQVDFLIYLPIIASILALPGPIRSRVINPKRNRVGNSPSPKIFEWCAFTIATHITTIKGIQASLVNNPNIKNIEQKNSAKITRVAFTVPPKPKMLGKCWEVLLKLVNLLKPWCIIKIPKPMRRINILILTAPALYFEEKILFM